jgi:hypothetical protein
MFRTKKKLGNSTREIVFMSVNIRFCFSLLMLSLMVGLVSVSPAAAFRVDPMSAEIATSGPDAKGEIRIENPPRSSHHHRNGGRAKGF